MSTLAGRNEAGFVIGSEAERDYFKAVALGPTGGHDEEAHEARRLERQKGRTAEKRLKREKVWREALLVPEWWGDTLAPTKQRNARYIARQRAIRAAFELGVDVPQWVSERTVPSKADVERIRAASLAMYQEAER